jgi:hypothetical protein
MSELPTGHDLQSVTVEICQFIFVTLSSYSHYSLAGLFNDRGNSRPQSVIRALNSQITQMDVGYMWWNRNL